MSGGAGPAAGSFLRPLGATAAVTLRGALEGGGLAAAFALVLASLAFGAALGGASLGSEERLVADIGWAAAGLMGWLLALTQGSGLADRGGVLGPSELARPVSWPLLLAGRFLGLALALGAYAALATAALLVVLGAGYGAAPAPVLAAGWLLLLRLVVLLSISVLFAALLRPAVAATLAAAAGAAGWFSGSLPPLENPDAPALLAAAARFLLPDFRSLAAVPGAGETASGVLAALAWPTLHAALYSAGTILAALVLFPFFARRGGPTAG